MTDRSDAARSGVSLPLALAALLVLWLATRSFAGIVRDAQYYAVQAIAWRDPVGFATDLFFAFGSQDRFSLISQVSGPLVAWLGVGPALALLLVLGQAMWLAGAWMLATALLPAMRLRLWALAGLIVLPAHFAWLSLVGYGEAVFTARLPAEALAMAGLALGLRGRMVPAVAVLLAAAALHPLMALPGLAVLVLMRLMARPGLGLAAVAAGLLVALSPLLLAGHVAALLPTLDPDWRAVVARSARLTLLSEWSAADHVGLLARFGLAALVLACIDGPARRLLAAATAVALAGVVLSVAGGDVAGIQIVLAGQPWRATWLLAVLGNLLLLPALLRLRAEGVAAVPGAMPTLVALVGAMLATQILPAAIFAQPPLLALALIQLLLHRRGGGRSRMAARALLLLLALALGWALTVLLLSVWVQVAQHAAVPWLTPRAALLMAGGLALLAAATGLVRAGRAAVLGAVLLPAVALATIDQRTPWQRHVETPGPDQAALEAFIPAGGQVFWDGGLDLLWLRLGRPAYFFCTPGIVFYRGTAMAFRDRGESFAFRQREGSCSDGTVLQDAPPTRADLARACRREPALDHIVLATRIEGLAPAATFHLPVARTPPNLFGAAHGPGEVFRYDCAALR